MAKFMKIKNHKRSDSFSSFVTWIYLLFLQAFLFLNPLITFVYL